MNRLCDPGDAVVLPSFKACETMKRASYSPQQLHGASGSVARVLQTGVQKTREVVHLNDAWTLQQMLHAGDLG